MLIYIYIFIWLYKIDRWFRPIVIPRLQRSRGRYKTKNKQRMLGDMHALTKNIFLNTEWNPKLVIMKISNNKIVKSYADWLRVFDKGRRGYLQWDINGNKTSTLITFLRISWIVPGFYFFYFRLLISFYWRIDWNCLILQPISFPPERYRGWLGTKRSGIHASSVLLSVQFGHELPMSFNSSELAVNGVMSLNLKFSEKGKVFL